MKRSMAMLLIAVLFVSLAVPAIAQKAEDRGKNFEKTKKVPSIHGTIKKINEGAETIQVSEKGTGKTKILKVTPTSILYKKVRAHQLQPYELKARLSAFKPGDMIVAILENDEGRILKVKKMWETNTWMVYTGQVNTEAEWAGVIKEIDKVAGVIKLQKMGETEIVDLKPAAGFKAYINNLPAKPDEFKVGDRIVAQCRWLGYEEDRPPLIPVREIKDENTFVIHTFREKFGPIITTGKVTAVDMSQKVIKISETEGTARTVAFGRGTKWIPGTTSIKKPGDFVNREVYVFGKVNKEKTPVAAQIVNVKAFPSLFDDLYQTQGSLPGEIKMLAMGELISLDSSRISIRVKGDRKYECRIHPKTIFVSKGKKVSMGSIKSGDWVMIRGMVTPKKPKKQPDVATVVVSFGKTNLKP